MSGALKRIQLTGEDQAWARKLGLVEWVKSKDWDPEPRFKIITRARENWTTVSLPDLADDPDSIVAAVYPYLERDQEFISYVLDVRKQDMTGDGEWEAAFKAYAMVVLQRYNRELGGEQGG